MIGKGMSWQEAQFQLEKYREQIRVIDVKIARLQLGADALSELRAKKRELQVKLKDLEAMKSNGEISVKVYEEKKKDLERQIENVERDIVETM